MSRRPPRCAHPVCIAQRGEGGVPAASHHHGYCRLTTHAGRLDFGAERMAHVNRQSVCSVEPALWADSWQRVSAGVVRRAACRSEIPSMFAVRMRVSRSRRELSSTCIEPSDERMGSVAGRTARSLRSPRAAIGESNREPRRRSDDAGSGALTQGSRSESRCWELVRLRP